jgi:hypothetical protein
VAEEAEEVGNGLGRAQRSWAKKAESEEVIMNRRDNSYEAYGDEHVVEELDKKVNVVASEGRKNT